MDAIRPQVDHFIFHWTCRSTSICGGRSLCLSLGLAVDFVNGFNGIGFSSLKRYRWAHGDKWLSMDHLESFCLVLHSTPHLIVSREMERTETLHTIMMRLAHSVGRSDTCLPNSLFLVISAVAS